jgi:hypothetical protein
MRSLAPKTFAEMMVGAAMTADPATAVFLIKDLLVDFIFFELLVNTICTDASGIT